MPTDPAPRNGQKRRWRWLIATLAVALAVIALLLTGVPQRYALEYGLRRALGTNVRVTGLSIAPSVRIRELVVTGDTDTPPVVIRGVDLDYALNLDSIVTISAVYVESIALDLRQNGEGATNYAFVERLLQGDMESKPSDEPPMDVAPYLPDSAVIGNLSISLESPRGNLSLDGLRMEADMESLLAMNARLLGENVHGFVSGAGLEGKRPVNGSIDLQFMRNMASVGFTASVALNDIATLDGTLHTITAVGTTAAQLRIEEGRFLDDRFAALLPGGLRFESLDVSGTEVTMSSPPGIPWDVNANIHVDGKGIRYGEPEHEWYQGDLQITGNYDGEQGDFEAVLNNGQRLSVLVSGEVKDIHVAATLIDWDRADLADALPKDFRPLLDELPHLSQIGASAEVRTQWPAYTVNASVDPLFTPEAGESERFALRIAGEGNTNAAHGDLFHGKLNATLGEGELNAIIDADSAKHYNGDFKVVDIDMARWLTPVQQRVPIAPPPGTLNGSLHIRNAAEFAIEGELSLDADEPGSDVSVTFTAMSESTESLSPLSGRAAVTFPTFEPPGTADIDYRFASDELSVAATLASVDLASAVSLVNRDLMPEGMAATLTGNANVTRDSERVSIALNVDAAPATIAGLTIPSEQPLHIEGTLRGPAAMSELRAETLALRLTDDATVDIGNLAIAFSPFTVKGHLTGRVDFDYVGPTIGLPTVVGALTADAPFTLADGVLEAPLRLEGDGFGYGKWAGPYGTPVILTGDARYALDTQSLGIGNAEVLWGENTRVTSAEVAAALSPFSLSAPFEVTTNLAPLVDLRFLDAADGTATANGTLGIGNGQQIRVEYDLAARSLTLSGAVAAFGGLSSSGNLVYGESLDGRVRFAAAEAAAAGAVLNDPRGICMIENGVAQATHVEASLYGGRTAFDATVNILDTDQGGRLDAHLEDIDLDRFTKEYEPPSVVLTGIANGDVSLVWAVNGLTDLRVDLASEENFSMNREIIENLLLQSVTADMTGLKRLNKRIREDTIGEGSQRPFDRAAVSLSLEGDTYEEQRLVGPVSLESEMLDLSIDLGVDLLAIASAMELQQQAQLGEGDTISAEPVQWGLPGESSNPDSNNSDDPSSSTAKEEES